MSEEHDGLVVYVVTDGGKARFLHDNGQGEMHDISDMNIHNDDDTPGKMPKGTTTPKEAAKDGFARYVADRMNGLVEYGAKVSGFVLAAPAEVLHEIKQHLRKTTEKKLIKTLTKDLTNIPNHDLPKHFDIPDTGWKIPH